MPTHHPRRTAGELEQIISEAQNNWDGHSPDEANAPDAAFVHQLVTAARSIKLDPSFDAQLRTQLRADAPAATAGDPIAHMRHPSISAVAPRQGSERAAWLLAGALVSASLIMVSAIAWSVSNDRNARFTGLPAWRAIPSAISLAPPPPGATANLSTRLPVHLDRADAPGTPGAMATPTTIR